jgi:hypothetical protein
MKGKMGDRAQREKPPADKEKLEKAAKKKRQAKEQQQVSFLAPTVFLTLPLSNLSVSNLGCELMFNLPFSFSICCYCVGAG